MAIIQYSKLDFFIHLLALTLIFILILTNTFIAVKEFEKSSSDTIVILGSYSLIILFVYAMYIGATYSLANNRDDIDIPGVHRLVLNLERYSSKGYDPVPSTYNNEYAKETA
jgi:hypothetical protein